jgi:hypothetical protein
VLGRKNKRLPTPYCLQCYYTTSAVRQSSEFVSILNEEQQQLQLPMMQELFSECYLELQTEIDDETTKAFQKLTQQTQRNRGGGGGGRGKFGTVDPLGMLLGTTTTSNKRNGSQKRKSSLSLLSPQAQQQQSQQPPAQIKKKKAGNDNDGGFLRDINIPERFQKSQQVQMEEAQFQQQQQQQTLQKRRKGSGKSIWNLAMDNSNTTNQSSNTTSTTTLSNERQQYQQHGNVSCTSCGSTDVQNFGNITSRNGDVRKGEIWGNTSRDSEVITRYQCNACGKTWNEEE